MTNYDVIFIGSGHAAWHAAVALKKAGRSVALIEEDTVAGTCTNWGCNAKMLLDGPADVVHQAEAYDGVGLRNAPVIDWPALMAYKHKSLDGAHTDLEQAFTKAGIDVIHDRGRLAGAHEVTVGDQTHRGDSIVLATGQHPRLLDVPGKQYLHNSRDFLDLPQMPARITFIGAGLISVEFAALARAAGAEVTVIEFGDRALRAFYPKHVDQVLAHLRDDGVQFRFGESVTSVEKNGDAFTVHTRSGLSVDSDYVLDATGRVPNVDGIGLDEAGVAHDRGGVIVDDHMRTNVQSIFASGDVVSKAIPKLTPTATFESNYIAGLILNPDADPIDYPAIASVAFTLPRIAQVGVSVAEAEKHPETYKVSTVPFGQIVFQTKNEPDAELVAVVDHDGHLAGASIVGDEAGELANLIELVVTQHLSADDLGRAVFAFPGQSDGVMEFLPSVMAAA